MGWQGPKAGGGMSPRGGGEGRRLEASQSNKIFCKILNRNESRELTCSNGRGKGDGVKDNIHNLSNFYALFAFMNIAKGPTPPVIFFEVLTCLAKRQRLSFLFLKSNNL